DGSGDGHGGATQLVAPNEVGEVLRSYELSPDGAFVLFLSHHEDGHIARLYSVPTSGGAPVCLAARDFAVEAFRIGPDGARVVFRGTSGRPGTLELESAPIDGSEPARNLSGAPRRGRSPQAFEFTSDGAGVVYLAEEGDGRNALFSVAADGSAPP